MSNGVPEVPQGWSSSTPANVGPNAPTPSAVPFELLLGAAAAGGCATFAVTPSASEAAVALLLTVPAALYPGAPIAAIEVGAAREQVVAAPADHAVVASFRAHLVVATAAL